MCCPSSPRDTRPSTSSVTARRSARTSRGSPSTAARASTAFPTIDDDQDRRYYAITVKPQVFVNLVPDHVIVHRVFPLAADRTTVECDWLYLPEVVDSGRDVDRSVSCSTG